MNILTFFKLRKVIEPKPVVYAVGQVWETISEPSHPWANDSIILQFKIVDMKGGWIRYTRYNPKSIFKKEEQDDAMRHETTKDFANMMAYREAKLISIK